MTENPAPGARPRRRADAERSRSAVLAAAARVLGTHQDAGLDDVAKEAGVSRQTVYAHFGSRENLVDAVLRHVTAEVVAAMAAVDTCGVSAGTTLLELLEVSRRTAEQYPLLLHDGAIGRELSRELHGPIVDRFTEVIERAQRDGEFTDRLSATWLVAAVISLAHTSAELAATGQLTDAEIRADLHTSILRLVHPG